MLQSYADFDYSKTAINSIIAEWEGVEKDSERARELRYLRYTKSEKLRQDGQVLADESYIPTRLIDVNIRREQPQFVAYLTQSRRSVVFNSLDGLNNPALDQLDILFTNKSRYLGWEVPFLRLIDGMQQHGWDSVEVVFDKSMPGHFAIEYVGHDNLMFPKDTEDIQRQPMIVRKITITALQLQQFVDESGFDSEQADLLLQQENKDSTAPTTKFYDIYKVMFKEQGFVWYCYYGGAPTSTWLLAPQKLYLGRHDITKPKQIVLGDDELPVNDALGQPIKDYPSLYETDYPIYLLSYVVSEDTSITECKGRAHFDEPAQEAASALLSSLVNGTHRAAGVYASPAQVNPSQPASGPPKLTDIVLESGRMYDAPLNFWHPAYPDTVVVTAYQTVLRANEQESSKVDYAVMNRKDSGKTATEVSAARQESQMLSSVQVTLLSIFIRSLYARCWSIFQNRVIQDKIVLSESLRKYFYQTDPQGTIVPVNYAIKSAGDIDVVQKAEKLQRMMQFWEVVNKTGLANEFLKDVIRVAFPEDSEKYVTILDNQAAQANVQKDQLITKLSGLVKELAVDSQTGQLRPELQNMVPQLQQLAAETQQVLGMQ